MLWSFGPRPRPLEARRTTMRTTTTPIPLLAWLLCLALALFQGVAVPSAGLITLVWMAVGVGIYFTLFSRRAEAVDAADVARNPLRSQARGENPLVLLPIANPASAAGLVSVAHALTPPRIGRVLLLFVVRRPDGSVKIANPLVTLKLETNFRLTP